MAKVAETVVMPSCVAKVLCRKIMGIMQPPNTDKSFPFLPVTVVLGLFVACFSGVIFQDRLFAFRDAAHFYYPLFAYIQQTWEAGQLPWWNPYENGGMPIGANPAASLFYPGKAIFFLIRDFDTAYRAYILAHVLLAAFWAYRLARHWNTSRPAATLAAVAYTFSGAVLIQYSNVIFLVGAAWLPAGVLAADRMLRHRRKRDAVLLGTASALVTPRWRSSNGVPSRLARPAFDRVACNASTVAIKKTSPFKTRGDKPRR